MASLPPLQDPNSLLLLRNNRYVIVFMLLALILALYKTSKGYSKGFTLNNIQFALLRVEDDKIIHGKGKNAQNFTRISPRFPTIPIFHPDRFHPQSLSITPNHF